jgi:hypothetical protein
MCGSTYPMLHYTTIRRAVDCAPSMVQKHPRLASRHQTQRPRAGHDWREIQRIKSETAKKRSLELYPPSLV